LSGFCVLNAQGLSHGPCICKTGFNGTTC